MIDGPTGLKEELGPGRPRSGVVKLFAPPAAGVEYARDHFAGMVAEAHAATANAVVSETTSSRQRWRITVR
jgi:hypothetical protein